MMHLFQNEARTQLYNLKQVPVCLHYTVPHVECTKPTCKVDEAMAWHAELTSD